MFQEVKYYFSKGLSDAFTLHNVPQYCHVANSLKDGSSMNNEMLIPCECQGTYNSPQCLFLEHMTHSKEGDCFLFWSLNCHRVWVVTGESWKYMTMNFKGTKNFQESWYEFLFVVTFDLQINWMPLHHTSKPPFMKTLKVISILTMLIK